MEVVWLEDEWQADDLQRRHQMGRDGFADLMASGLIERLSDPRRPTRREFFEDITPPAEPTSLELLIDRLWHKSWEDNADNNSNDDLHRDERWLNLLEPRLAGLREGWVALMVGWLHADPNATGRLCQLLSQRGFEVEPVRLGP